MFQFSRWLSLYWFVGLPLSSFLTAGVVYRTKHRRWQKDPVSRIGLRWLLVGLASSQIYFSLLIINSLYETLLWPAGAAVVAVLAMVFAKQISFKQIHTNQKTPPLKGSVSDSLFVDEKYPSAFFGWRVLSKVSAAIPFLAGMAIIVYVLFQQSNRWWGLWLIGFGLLSSLYFVRQGGRYNWLIPTCLILIALAFGWQGTQLRQALPPGNWSTPVTGASCSTSIHFDLDRKYAWCANERSGWVYQFKPITGIVGQSLVVDNGAQTFAGNSSLAWVMQNPLKGLVLVENGQQTPVKINLAQQGTVDREGRLWVVDVTGALWVRDPTGVWKRLTASDGLLDNTANVVKTSPDGSIWVGSIGGVSRLVNGSSDWEHIIRTFELPGPVQDFAFTNDGKVWYLWEAASAYRNRVRWGVSLWQKYQWSHFELGADTGLDYPPSNHSIAVDGLDRVWFVAPSYIKKTNYLGILEPHRGLVSIYYLGPFDISSGEGFPIPGFYGVIDDGSGGIFVYNPKFLPLRHWRPDQQQEHQEPCIQPCGIANHPDLLKTGRMIESDNLQNIVMLPQQGKFSEILKY